MVMSLWTGNATMKDDASRIPPPKFALRAQGAVEACDADDGVRDGIIAQSADVPVRSARAAVQGRRRGGLPDRAAGRGGARDLRGARRIRARASRSIRASRRAARNDADPDDGAGAICRRDDVLTGPGVQRSEVGFPGLRLRKDVDARVKAYGSDALDVPPTGLDRFVAGGPQAAALARLGGRSHPRRVDGGFLRCARERRRREEVRATTCGSSWCPAWALCRGRRAVRDRFRSARSTAGSRPARRRSGSSRAIRRLPRSARGRCARIRRKRSTRVTAARTRKRISAAKRRSAVMARPNGVAAPSLDPANKRLPSAVVTERAFEFVLPSRAREPSTVTTSPASASFASSPDASVRSDCRARRPNRRSFSLLSGARHAHSCSTASGAAGRGRRCARRARSRSGESSHAGSANPVS